MRVLIIVKQFPNRARPLADPFNRQQFAELARLCDVEVVNPLPWFPGVRALSRWTHASLEGVPEHDEIAGMTVRHPRVLHLPKIGRALAGLLTTSSLLPLAAEYRDRVDLILGSWAYPHGTAAVALARLLGVPSVVKVHGSDINVLADLPGPRANMRLLLPRANRIVAVSRALARKVEDLGVEPHRIDVVYNGVNTELFFPRDRNAERRRLGRSSDEQIALYIGALKQPKGVLDAVAAFERVAAALPRAQLVVIGEGPARAALEKLARAVGWLTIVGPKPLEEVASWLGACDVLTLPSWNEGTPNVVLEAFASGRKVVASDVGGIPDLITSDRLGYLVPARQPNPLALALERALCASYDPSEVAQLGCRGNWQSSARDLFASLQRAMVDPL